MNWRGRVPRRSKTVALNAADVRAYAAKAEEYLEAAEDALDIGRYNAATSVHLESASFWVRLDNAIFPGQGGFSASMKPR